MRGVRPLAFAIVLGLVAMAPAPVGGTTPDARLRLPAPITISTGRLSYVIALGGRVRHVRSTQDRLPRGEVLFPLTNTWFRIGSGHLIVGRGGSKAMWRSSGGIEARQLGVVMIGPRDVAFQRDHRLYLASLNGREHPVARRELPLGWTRGGLYTYRYHGRELLLRSDSGALIRTIARRPLGSDYFVSNGSLYFIAGGVPERAGGTRTGGVLERADRTRTRQLATLASLGVSRDSWLQPTGRLLELEDNQRLVVLGRDGARFASIALREGQSGGLSSPLVAAPRASVVAFTATVSHGSGVAETVYLLPRGANRAVPLHTEWVRGGGCEGGTNLQWHGDWLLYSDSQGKLAAIDTAGAHRTIELSGLIRRLARTGQGFGAYWTGHPIGL